MTTKKRSSLEEALKGIEDTFGEGMVIRMSDPSREIAVVPTGLPSLDTALDIGGFPKGRIVEIFGVESGGKSTIALQAVAEAQNLGLTCAYMDMEYGLEPHYAARLGVDTEHLLISQPDTMEEVFEILERLINTGEVGLIVVDSVAAMSPRAEIEGDFGDANVGLVPRLMSQGLRKISNALKGTNTILIFINQLREKVGVMFGPSEITPGGRALKFYSTIRLEVRRIETVKDSGVATGTKVRIKIVKNRLGTPYRECEVDLVFGHGFSRSASLLDLAIERGVITKAGAWFATSEGERVGQGRTKAREALETNAELRAWVEDRIFNVEI